MSEVADNSKCKDCSAVLVAADTHLSEHTVQPVQHRNMHVPLHVCVGSVAYRDAHVDTLQTHRYQNELNCMVAA